MLREVHTGLEASLTRLAEASSRVSDLDAVRPPQLMGSVRWKLTEPEMGRSQTMTPPEKNISEHQETTLGFFFRR